MADKVIMLGRLSYYFIVLADKTPFQVLGGRTYGGAEEDFQNALGIPQLIYVMLVFGCISCVIHMEISLASLAVINNPMLASKTKVSIVRSAVTLMALRLLPLIADIIYNIICTTLNIR